ncbi:MAG: hypothetical protein RMI94_09690 [Bryobacterales bacterium]|nr:hypothetical protein [Bryobacteraceae bacterium]MDW8130807.1 hypothetical protein [Bryobacterales bacterium]
MPGAFTFALAALLLCRADAQPLRMSVYVTAGGVEKYLGEPANRQRAVQAMKALKIARVFLEGRRGDEYVSPERMREIADALRREGFVVSGGIATVPGHTFGVRQNGGLNWLNYEAEKTRKDIATYFRQHAPLFDELIVDDFYCTADTTPESERSRAERSWADYRQDLLVSLAEPMMLTPARAARPGIRVTVKYPQWYDRFHLFGYNPRRLSQYFDAVWVGTETRNPETPRMGYVQPTQGWINFRWIRAIAGEKVRGAWFDHIDCTAQNFLDQAYQSVLAGARELTLFHLGDLIAGHPGDALLAARLPDLETLASRILGREPQGIAFYKPPASDADENLYLMDYVAMLGLPLVPAADYPRRAQVAMLGAQAAKDPRVAEHVRAHLDAGATLVVTPALLRRVRPLAEAAGVRVTAEAQPTRVAIVHLDGGSLALGTPIEVDAGLSAAGATVLMAGTGPAGRLPLLTRRGRLLVWNIRTFNEEDFRQAGEWLLPPRPLGWVRLPDRVVNELRLRLLEPMKLRLEAPPRVAFYDFDGLRCFYNFRDETATVRLDGKAFEVAGHTAACTGDL